MEWDLISAASSILFPFNGFCDHNTLLTKGLVWSSRAHAGKYFQLVLPIRLIVFRRGEVLWERASMLKRIAATLMYMCRQYGGRWWPISLQLRIVFGLRWAATICVRQRSHFPSIPFTSRENERYEIVWRKQVESYRFSTKAFFYFSLFCGRSFTKNG